MTKTTAVAVVPTQAQKQQVVAAFMQSGTLERAKPLIATLWGCEVAQLPDDVQLRAWVGDVSVKPEKEDVALAERFAQALHRAKLLEFDEAVIDAGIAKVREGSPKFFQIMGAHKLIGARVDPIVAVRNTTYDMRGASFKTTKKYRDLNDDTEEAIEGEFAEIEGNGGD